MVVVAAHCGRGDGVAGQEQVVVVGGQKSSQKRWKIQRKHAQQQGRGAAQFGCEEVFRSIFGSLADLIYTKHELSLY